MKTVGMEKATLDRCVAAAQRERVLVTRNGRPIALIVGLEGLDDEQIALGTDEEFWNLISKRRKQKTVDRATLEKSLNRGDEKGKKGSKAKMKLT